MMNEVLHFLSLLFRSISSTKLTCFFPQFSVAIGESTCQAKFWNAPVGAGGQGVIEVSQMSRIALERTKSAREAIQLMGDLATKLGYYSCTYSGGNDADYLVSYTS